MRRKLPTVASACLLAGLALAGAALAGNGGAGPPAPESPNAHGISQSYWLIALFTGLIFVGVETALIVFAVRFRSRGRRRDADGPQIHGSTKLELIWTVGPVVVLAIIGGFVFYKLPGIKNVPSATAGNQLAIDVVGQQFSWEFRYPNGVVAVDRLIVPLDAVVALDVTAPEGDVIHSWWVPRLGGKIDAIPGRVNHTWFKAESVGTYRGQCAELCGIQHTAMVASVTVLPRDEFDRWLLQQAEAQKAGTSDLGAQTFAGACLKCHRLSGDRLYGPNLSGNALLKDPQGLTKLLLEGRGKMPAVGKNWPDEQLQALLAYAKTQGGANGG